MMTRGNSAANAALEVAGSILDKALKGKRDVQIVYPVDAYLPALTTFLEALEEYGYSTTAFEINDRTDLADIIAAFEGVDLVVVFRIQNQDGRATALADLKAALLDVFEVFRKTAKNAPLVMEVGDGEALLPGHIMVETPSAVEPRDIAVAAARVANNNTKLRYAAIEAKTERLERQERIEQKASEYIDDAITELRDRERTWKAIAHTSHAAGFLSLLIGIGSVLYFVSQAIGNVGTVVNWPVVAYLGLKSVIIVGLLVAASKYAFTIGRSYMNEALKNADRVHAINFGTFYLNAYGDKATWAELKEVFQHWNIARDSGFAALDSNQFDPQILSAAVEIAKSLTPGDKSRDKK